MRKAASVRRRLAAMDADALDRALRLLEPSAGGVPVGTPSRGYDVLRPLLVGHDVECFAVAFLSSRSALISAEVVSQGGMDCTVVDLRVIFRRALLHGAAAILVGHNHPSGDSSPSKTDIETTDRIVSAADLLGIRFVDHIIVTDGGYTSMAESGQLPSRSKR